MKVAIVHDYIKEYGGAERVLESMHDIWRDAEIFTSVYLPGFLGPHKARFRKWEIHTSFMQNLPFKEKLISIMRIFSSSIFKAFDFSKFDIIIVSSTGAYIPNLINKEKAVQICYCHTPPRYLYGYPTARNWKNTFIGQVLGEIINHSLRLSDYNAAKKVDFYIANSNEVRKRIKKFYRREATVIYPPAGLTDGTRPGARADRVQRKGDYYLTGGRLARSKHIDLIISAANKMKFKLKIFGKAFAGYNNELRNIAGDSVEFTGEVDDFRLSELYRNCRALIYASEYEDFGIMPVEAQKFGRPVIAFRSGGVTESIVEGKTGIFFDKLAVESVISAIKKFEKTSLKREDCIKNAAKFSLRRFQEELVKFVNNSREAGL